MKPTTADDGREPDSLEHGMARGAAWMVGMRWTIRAIGLVNVIILARLVTPEDFGIIAMATVLVGFLEAISEITVDEALLRDRSAGRAEYDSAWTLQIVFGLLQATVLVILAPFLATYYGDPRVEIVIYIIALRPAIGGFENIGQVEFRRDLRFDKEFRYWVYRRLLAFALTLGLVLWLRNYIALALAAPLTAVVMVLTSFVMSAYRPRLSVSRIRELWAFAGWWMLVTSLSFFGRRGEELILGRVTTPEVVGAYFVGASLSMQLTQEIVGAVNRALIPSYARIAHDPEQLARSFQLTFGALATFSLAAGVGASVVAEDLVLALLGNRWSAATPFVQWLALNGALWSMARGMMPLLIVTRRERLVALCYLGYVAVALPAIFTVAQTGNPEVVAMARTAVSLLFVAGMFAVLVALRAFTLARILDVFWRPVIATAAMAACVMSIELAAPHIVALALRVTAGVAVFSATHALLWLAAGRPQGIESALFSLAGELVGRRRDRRQIS